MLTPQATNPGVEDSLIHSLLFSSLSDETLYLNDLCVGKTLSPSSPIHLFHATFICMLHMMLQLLPKEQGPVVQN